MRVVRRCRICGRGFDFHEKGDAPGLPSRYWEHADHPFQNGSALIELNEEEADLFIEQGNESTFKGNDLLYPLYEQLKKQEVR